MTLTQKDFWGKILRRPTEGIGALTRLELLNEAKIRQLNVSIIGNEYVLRFQVSIDEGFRVHMLKTEDYLGGVEPCEINLQSALPPDQFKHLSTLYALHKYIE